MSIENIQSSHLTESIDSKNNVSRESIENLAFITVESRESFMQNPDKCKRAGKWIRKKVEVFDKQEEAYQNFLDTIHNLETLEMYDRNLTRFLKVSGIKSYDEITTISRKEIQEKLKQHVRFLKNNPKIHANSITGTMAGIFKFLIANEVDFNDRNIKSMYPDTKKPLNAEAYSLEQMQMLVGYAGQSPNRRNKAIVLTIASSGMRKGALPVLKMKDLKMIEDTYLIIVYSGENEEYVTFMTPEAADVLKEYFAQREAKGEVLTEESYVFTSKHGLGNQMNVVSFGSVVEYLLQQSGVKSTLRKDEERGRFNIAGVHGMRKFCDTQMEESGLRDSKIQKMIGHVNGLKGLYFDAKSEKLYEEYKKAIPLLTIQKHVREQNKIAELEGQLSANDFIKSEEIRTQETQLEQMRQQQIEQMAKMQEKIAELEIRLSQRD
jgi:site-specific recombinase XerD